MPLVLYVFLQQQMVDRTHVELLDGRTTALVGRDLLHLHDLDGVGAGAVARSHVPVWKEGETDWLGLYKPASHWP